MTKPAAPLPFPILRSPGVVRDARLHPLARLQPRERRALSSGLSLRRRSDEPYVREFRIA